MVTETKLAMPNQCALPDACPQVLNTRNSLRQLPPPSVAELQQGSTSQLGA